MLKRFLKNERGLTLVELLAVVVILGIIAGIAVPSIGGLIDNTKKDAHVANARQMINVTKIAVAGNANLLPEDNTEDVFISLKYLEANGYLDDLKDPDGSLTTYQRETTATPVILDEAPDDVSYVQVKYVSPGNYTYSVRLANGTRGVQAPTTADAVLETALDRGDVITNP